MAQPDETPITYSPPREVTPIPGQELARVERLPSIHDRLEALELQGAITEVHLKGIKAEQARGREERRDIKDSIDGHFDTLLQAVVAREAAQPLKNTSVQVILAVAFLLVIGAAVGKDFILDTPMVDVTTSPSTTEGP
jgi:hypothetical protein